jgi:hypothetical protein
MREELATTEETALGQWETRGIDAPPMIRDLEQGQVFIATHPELPYEVEVWIYWGANGRFNADQVTVRMSHDKDGIAALSRPVTGATLHAIPLAALVRDYLAKTIGREVPGVPSISGSGSVPGSFSATSAGTVTPPSGTLAVSFTATSAGKVTPPSGTLAVRFTATDAGAVTVLPPVEGPQSWPVPELVEVANVYLQALRLGEPPQKTVAEHFGWSRSIASKKVMACRAAGLLGTTTRGKAAP